MKPRLSCPGIASGKRAAPAELIPSSKPEPLWTACKEYFEWNEANPLHEAKAFAYEGAVTITALPKVRAMTIAGLCMFLDIAVSTWDEWRKNRPDLSEVSREQKPPSAGRSSRVHPPGFWCHRSLPAIWDWWTSPSSAGA